MIAKAQPSETVPFYLRYLNQIPDQDMLALLENQAKEIVHLFTNLTPEKLNFAYAPGKWSLKELFGHMVDTERIMAYRTLCIARGETISLPGFDENAYVENAEFKNRDLENLITEYKGLRQSNLALFQSFNDEVLARSGSANNSPATVRGIISIIAAHEFHHLQIIKSQYLQIV